MMPRKKKGPRITVSLSQEDHIALTALAEQHDVSISWLTRKAITDLLELHETNQLKLPLDRQRGAGQ